MMMVAAACVVMDGKQKETILGEKCYYIELPPTPFTPSRQILAKTKTPLMFTAFERTRKCLKKHEQFVARHDLFAEMLLFCHGNVAILSL